MADVRPFRGLRFNPALVADLGRVLCPPYDVVSADDERRYLEHDPRNAVRIELSIPTAQDPERYSRAADTLRAWREQGILVFDESPAMYLHEATFEHEGRSRTRRELIAAVGLEPWDRRVVLPHERTFDRAKADRLRLLEATVTNVSPILSFFRRDRPAGDAVSAAWVWAESRSPTAVGTDLDGVSHRLWMLQDPALVEGLRRFFDERPLFIADGHHRYETALHYTQRRRAADTAEPSPDDPAGAVMMHLIAENDPGLVILPIHRLLRGLDGLGTADLEARLAPDFDLDPFEPDLAASAEQRAGYLALLRSRGRADRVIGIYGPDPAGALIASPRDRGSPPAGVAQDRDPSWQNLDVVVAEAAVIRPLLAERGLEAENAIDYTRDADQAIRLVRAGERQLAVLLNPTRVGQIADVALAGERMPEKSTYFYPKAPTGLVFRPLE